MRKLDDFLPWVLPYAYGCTDDLARQMIRDACIEFCSDTSIVQGVDSQDVVAGTAEYAISAPTQQTLSSVLKVFYNANELRAVALDDVRHGAAARAALDTTVEPARGTPTMYHQTTPQDQAVYLWPVPDTSTTGALAIRAAFEPTRTATQVDDVLYDDYALVIAYGALSRLLVIPGQSFYNPQQANAFAGQFRMAVQAARRDSTLGAVRSGLRVQPRAFA